jgi:hypothetical protein
VAGLRDLVGPVTAVAGATRRLRPWLLDAVDGASLRTE